MGSPSGGGEDIAQAGMGGGGALFHPGSPEQAFWNQTYFVSSLFPTSNLASRCVNQAMLIHSPLKKKKKLSHSLQVCLFSQDQGKSWRPAAEHKKCPAAVASPNVSR